MNIQLKDCIKDHFSPLILNGYIEQNLITLLCDDVLQPEPDRGGGSYSLAMVYNLDTCTHKCGEKI